MSLVSHRNRTFRDCCHRLRRGIHRLHGCRTLHGFLHLVLGHWVVRSSFHLHHFDRGRSSLRLGRSHDCGRRRSHNRGRRPGFVHHLHVDRCRCGGGCRLWKVKVIESETELRMRLCKFNRYRKVHRVGTL